MTAAQCALRYSSPGHITRITRWLCRRGYAFVPVCLSVFVSTLRLKTSLMEVYNVSGQSWPCDKKTYSIQVRSESLSYATLVLHWIAKIADQA